MDTTTVATKSHHCRPTFGWLVWLAINALQVAKIFGASRQVSSVTMLCPPSGATTLEDLISFFVALAIQQHDLFRWADFRSLCGWFVLLLQWAALALWGQSECTPHQRSALLQDAAGVFLACPLARLRSITRSCLQ